MDDPAGNPLRERWRRDGEADALAWAQAQDRFDAHELAAMMAELVTECDPTVEGSLAAGVRLCDRGLALDPDQPDLPGYRLQLLVLEDRVDEALEHARRDPVLFAHFVGIVGEGAPERLPLVLDALDAAMIAAIATRCAELVPALVQEIGLHAPERLATVLAALAPAEGG